MHPQNLVIAKFTENVLTLQAMAIVPETNKS